MKLRRSAHAVHKTDYHIAWITKYRKKILNKGVYWGTGSIWSKGYFVSTVGLDKEIIRNYVKMQGEEDSGQAKLELK